MLQKVQLLEDNSEIVRIIDLDLPDNPKKDEVQTPSAKMRRVSGPILRSPSTELQALLSKTRLGPHAAATELQRQLNVFKRLKEDGEDGRLAQLIKKWRDAFLQVLPELLSEEEGRPKVEFSLFGDLNEEELAKGTEDEKEDESSVEEEDETRVLSRRIGIDLTMIGFDAAQNAFTTEVD